jgi:hypothetical protein
VPADVLIDVWMFKEGQCGIELNVHPDDIEDVGTCVMISGPALTDLIDAIGLISKARAKDLSVDNVVTLMLAKRGDDQEPRRVARHERS